MRTLFPVELADVRPVWAGQLSVSRGPSGIVSSAGFAEHRRRQQQEQQQVDARQKSSSRPRRKRVMAESKKELRLSRSAKISRPLMSPGSRFVSLADRVDDRYEKQRPRPRRDENPAALPLGRSMPTSPKPLRPRRPEDKVEQDSTPRNPAPPPAHSADDYADLLIERNKLELDMSERERRYEGLLMEVREALEKLRCERDELARQCESLAEALDEERTKVHLRRPLTPPSGTAQDSHIHPLRPRPRTQEATTVTHTATTPRDTAAGEFAYRRTADDLTVLLQHHDDTYFRDGFLGLEASIRRFVLSGLRRQKEVITAFELTPLMTAYLARHQIDPGSTFLNKDLRAVAARGFLIDLLLERCFRGCFLFGLRNGGPLKEAFEALAASGEDGDRGRASRWAATVARNAVATSLDYRPDNAAAHLSDELRTHLECFIDTKQSFGSLAQAPDPNLPNDHGETPDDGDCSLRGVVDRAGVLARACRLDHSVFTITLPAYAAEYDCDTMDSSSGSRGRVFVAFAPAVTRSGTRLNDGYKLPTPLTKARVWRENVLDDVHQRMSK
ncbi:hypothetical protein PYCC9005_002326 [Savitreella phatthalungensis]